jgi:hypothetical protein
VLGIRDINAGRKPRRFAVQHGARSRRRGPRSTIEGVCDAVAALLLGPAQGRIGGLERLAISSELRSLNQGHTVRPMRRIRVGLSVLLGLLLVAQGFAVAAAGHPSVAAEPAQAQVDAADSGAAMPCHGDPAQPADGASCCDGDCPNMTTCALGHLAVTAPMHVDPIPVSREFSSARVVPPVAASPQTLLRPPIALHA